MFLNQPNGELLATGCYDSIGRVWYKNGTMKFVLKKHEAAILCIRWNSSGSLIATGAADRTAILWDSGSGESRQQFSFHSDPILDIAWKDDVTFATCSVDREIYINELGSLEPLHQFSGHKADINKILWDPSEKYLASSSDDYAVKIWTMDNETPVLDLTYSISDILSMVWITISERSFLAT